MLPQLGPTGQGEVLGISFIDFQDLLLVISIETHYGEHDHIHMNSHLLLAADFDELKLSNPLSSYLVQVAAHNLYNGHRL